MVRDVEIHRTETDLPGNGGTQALVVGGLVLLVAVVGGVAIYQATQSRGRGYKRNRGRWRRRRAYARARASGQTTRRAARRALERYPLGRAEARVSRRTR